MELISEAKAEVEVVETEVDDHVIKVRVSDPINYPFLVMVVFNGVCGCHANWGVLETMWLTVYINKTFL